jgi:hypothetical protein
VLLYPDLRIPTEETNTPVSNPILYLLGKTVFTGRLQIYRVVGWWGEQAFALRTQTRVVSAIAMFRQQL